MTMLFLTPARALIVAFAIGLPLAGCKREASDNGQKPSTQSAEKEVIRVTVGTQDSTINCAAGGLVIRELSLLEKHLPHAGRYANVTYAIEWRNFTSGPPLTSDMVAGKIDIGMMADFPSVLNYAAFQKQGKKSVYVATLSGDVHGAGNGLVVPVDSTAQSLADLKGKQISVPFGSAAHGMILRAIDDLGWDAEKDVTLVSQSPEVGGSSLQSHKIDAHADFVPFAELFPFRGYARKILDGSTTNVPTSHGVLANADYAAKYPEIVDGFLEASLEASDLFAAAPEKYSELTQKVAGVDAEVVYMFHGPLGIQTRDYSIKPEFRQGLKTAAATLKLLKKTDTDIDVGPFVDEQFIRRAASHAGKDYEARLRDYSPLPIGKDVDGKPIAEPKLAAQIWVKGEPKVRAYATIDAALVALKAAEASGVRATYVHDRTSGAKLLAQYAWYVRREGEIGAFLLKKDADAWAKDHGGAVARYADLRGTSLVAK